jgi:transposase-like protein
MKNARIETLLGSYFFDKRVFREELFEYAVILVRNKKIEKIVQNYKDKHASRRFFDTVLKDFKVVYPKKMIVNNDLGGTVEDVYEILYVQKKREGSGFRKIITGLGVFEEKVNGDWEILDKAVFEQEETFRIFGYPNRMTYQELIANIFLEKLDTGLMYDISILTSKVIITDGADDLTVINCKSPDEAGRLHNTLMKYFHSENVTNFFFSGNIPLGEKRRDLISKIMSKYNVTYIQVVRILNR